MNSTLHSPDSRFYCQIRIVSDILFGKYDLRDLVLDGDDVEMRLKRNKCESMSLIHMLQNNVHFLVLVQ